MAKKKPETGRYDTRDALIQNIHFFYYHTNQSQTQVAKTTGVSESTVASILKQITKR